MQEDLSNAGVPADDQFGVTPQEEQNLRLKGFLGRMKYYWLTAEPTLVKIFNMIVYNTIKFIKSVVTSIVRMAIKGE